MRTVGIKLADGSFYPIMEEGSAQTKKLELTTANDNQTCVMVDLYRSKTCSMEDAEYIDTLKIENLNAHQNGEPSISFDVGLDENGELSASIADPETGATSNSQLTLVSRTAEERLVTDDFAVDEPVVEDAPAEEETSVEEPAEEDSDSGNGAAVAAGVVAGAGLLAAAGVMAANKDKDNDDELPSEEVSLTDEDIEDVTGSSGLDSFTFEDAPTTDTPTDETISDDTGLEAFSLDDTPSEDTIADELTSDDSAADETISDEALPDMDFDMPEESTEPVAEDATITDESFDLPDDTTQASDDSFEMPEDTTQASDDSFDMPEDTTQASDDSFDMPEDTTQTADDSFDMPDDTTQAADDSFDLPDDSTISDDSNIPGDETILEDETFAAPSELTEDTEDFFNDAEPTPSPSEGLNFSGLYDKETEMGDSAAHEEDDIKKKTRAPVIICIVCAIICIIATLLVLLVLPGKFNLRQKMAEKKSQTAVEKQAETTTAPEPVEEKKPDPVPQAKEDEVVVIEKAEEVKPAAPAATETKSKNVTYKIKWGDTLWDIADTYYKNPWRYKKIANYNGIKNPDHIISGTIITIPAE